MRSTVTAITFATAIILGNVGGALAQTYVAENRLKVVPLNGSDFEVIEARGEGARGIWCAAASYALHSQRMQRHQRIYVKTARGPS